MTTWTSYNRSIYEEVEAKLSHQDSAHVEEIQDMIERALFRSGYFDTAKAFITYRFLHKMQREQLGGLYSGNTYVDCKQTVEEYIGQSDWRIAANSNTTYSNAGHIRNLHGKSYSSSHCSRQWPFFPDWASTPKIVTGISIQQADRPPVCWKCEWNTL